MFAIARMVLLGVLAGVGGFVWYRRRQAYNEQPHSSSHLVRPRRSNETEPTTGDAVPQECIICQAPVGLTSNRWTCSSCNFVYHSKCIRFLCLVVKECPRCGTEVNEDEIPPSRRASNHVVHDEESNEERNPEGPLLGIPTVSANSAAQDEIMADVSGEGGVGHGVDFNNMVYVEIPNEERNHEQPLLGIPTVSASSSDGVRLRHSANSLAQDEIMAEAEVSGECGVCHGKKNGAWWSCPDCDGLCHKICIKTYREWRKECPWCKKTSA